MTSSQATGVTGRAATATLHLINHSVLGDHHKFAEHFNTHGPDHITISLNGAHNWSGWSRGELALLGVVDAMIRGGHVDLVKVLADLDTEHRHAVWTALGLYLGVA